MSDPTARCGCDYTVRLEDELAESAVLLMRSASQFTRRRLEVIELRLRWRLTLARNEVWSTIPEIQCAQEARRERLRHRYCAVRFLRSVV